MFNFGNRQLFGGLGSSDAPPVEPTEVVATSPLRDAIGVSPAGSIAFTVVTNANVARSTFIVTINGQRVFKDSRFQRGWRGTVVMGTTVDFTFKPPRPFPFGMRVIVEVSWQEALEVFATGAVGTGGALASVVGVKV